MINLMIPWSSRTTQRIHQVNKPVRDRSSLATTASCGLRSRKLCMTSGSQAVRPMMAQQLMGRVPVAAATGKTRLESAKRHSEL